MKLSCGSNTPRGHTGQANYLLHMRSCSTTFCLLGEHQVPTGNLFLRFEIAGHHPCDFQAFPCDLKLRAKSSRLRLLRFRALRQAYNSVVFTCLEENIGFGIVWEGNCAGIWLKVWRSLQLRAHAEGKELLVLTSVARYARRVRAHARARYVACGNACLTIATVS